MTRLLPALGSLLLLPLALAALAQTPQAQPAAPKPGFYAIAIHGGAGTIPKTVPNEERVAYLKSLGAALELGRGILAKGGTSLDAVEKVVNYLEDD
ncbi:MAG TPA: isoaspartyl peptidase/L-asparaginase, partial [Thermoanaerobaculia bacterium]